MNSKTNFTPRISQQKSCFWILISCLFLLPGINLSAQKIPSGPELEKVILQHDSLFWLAYNDCDLDGMDRFMDDNVEFYHDKGGRLDGAASFRKAMKNGLCSEGRNQIFRKPVAETIKVFPLAGVGAILRGQHTFHGVDRSDDNGIAYFFHLWELKPEGWKMTRIFSYDHAPLTTKQP